MNPKQKLLKELPSVDEIIKSPKGIKWCKIFPRRHVLKAIREIIEIRRKIILDDKKDLSKEESYTAIEKRIYKLSSFSLRPVINATGIVIHTNLGRSVLTHNALDNVARVSENYSNLEYDLKEGKRGKRYAHVVEIIKEVTGAEDAIIVNNNAAAVLLCLNTLARDKEVIVSRSELVEIGGSFRLPDVMISGMSILKEVGTTNKTRLDDYINAVNQNTALLLKVHQSNFKIVGFTDSVSIEELKTISDKHNIPLLFDLGSGCLIDLKPYGILNEPTVQEIVKAGVDVITFSGDKLLGGPQAGIIIGKKKYIEMIQKNPLTRAVRIDKLTLAALESILHEYLDEEKAIENIPTLRMLLQKPEIIKARAEKIASNFKYLLKKMKIEVMEDFSQAGGGSLPGIDFPTYAVSIKPKEISVNQFEEQLRSGTPPVICRIKDNSIIIDAKTINEQEIEPLADCIKNALEQLS
ncbi:MAG: L-seryl-tRNA(Sec) selenium transferase [Nitrospiraceae bacterium]|nr:L-seryl-tRNA(Sec) selenium transferase [Nitrospiraceae bacterium]